MRITLVGSRHFGVTTLQMLRQHDVDVVRVVVAEAEDRLATTAREVGIEVVVQAKPLLVVASEIAESTDLSRHRAEPGVRISKEALAAARLGGIGYHPSLLPRHRGPRRRGMDHPREGSDCRRHRIPPRRSHGCRRDRCAGLVLSNRKGRNRPATVGTRTAPMGQKLLAEVIDYAKAHDALPSTPQEEQFATKAPALAS